MGLEVTVISLDFRASSTPITQSFSKREIIIGRAKTCDLVLPSAEISKEHLRVKIVETLPMNDSGETILSALSADGTSSLSKRLFVTDLGSSNGTLVENAALPAHVERELSPNERILVGNYLLKVTFSEEPAIVVHENVAQKMAVNSDARGFVASTLGVLNTSGSTEFTRRDTVGAAGGGAGIVLKLSNPVEGFVRDAALPADEKPAEKLPRVLTFLKRAVGEKLPGRGDDAPHEQQPGPYNHSHGAEDPSVIQLSYTESSYVESPPSIEPEIVSSAPAEGTVPEVWQHAAGEMLEIDGAAPAISPVDWQGIEVNGTEFHSAELNRAELNRAELNSTGLNSSEETGGPIHYAYGEDLGSAAPATASHTLDTHAHDTDIFLRPSEKETRDDRGGAPHGDEGPEMAESFDVKSGGAEMGVYKPLESTKELQAVAGKNGGPADPRAAFGDISGRTALDDVNSLDFEAVRVFGLAVEIKHNGVPLSDVVVDAGVLGSVTTESSGRVIFDEVPEDTRVNLICKKDGFLFEGAPQGVLLKEETEAHVIAKRLWALRGRVTHHGAPLSGVQVRLSPSRVMETNVDGVFDFSPVVEDELVSFSVQKAHYSFQLAEVPEYLTDDIELPVEATKLVSVSGVVMYRGKPVAGAEVDGGALGKTVTDDHGRYLFKEVEEGTEYTIQVKKAGFRFIPRSGVATAALSPADSGQRYMAEVSGSAA